MGKYFKKSYSKFLISNGVRKTFSTIPVCFLILVLSIFLGNFSSAATTLPVVELVYPKDGEINVPLVPTLQWKAVSGANAYLISVRFRDIVADPVWEKVVGDIQSKEMSVSMKSNTDYKWCVKGIKTRAPLTDISPNPDGTYNFEAVDRLGVEAMSPECRESSQIPTKAQPGEWYRFRTMQVALELPAPIPSSPLGTEQNPSLVPLPVILQWTKVDNASGYDYNVSSPDNVSLGGSVQSKEITQIELKPDKFYLYSKRTVGSSIYQWRPVSFNGDQRRYGKWQYFKVTLQKPTNLSPNQTETGKPFRIPPTLSWNPVPGADKYQWEVSAKQDNFDAGLISKGVEYSTSINLNTVLQLSSGQNFYWRVKGIKVRTVVVKAGETGEWTTDGFVPNGTKMDEYGLPSDPAAFYYEAPSYTTLTLLVPSTAARNETVMIDVFAPGKSNLDYIEVQVSPWGFDPKGGEGCQWEAKGVKWEIDPITGNQRMIPIYSGFTVRCGQKGKTCAASCSLSFPLSATTYTITAKAYQFGKSTGWTTREPPIEVYPAVSATITIGKIPAPANIYITTAKGTKISDSGAMLKKDDFPITFNWTKDKNVEGVLLDLAGKIKKWIKENSYQVSFKDLFGEIASLSPDAKITINWSLRACINEAASKNPSPSEFDCSPEIKSMFYVVGEGEVASPPPAPPPTGGIPGPPGSPSIPTNLTPCGGQTGVSTTPTLSWIDAGVVKANVYYVYLGTLTRITIFSTSVKIDPVDLGGTYSLSTGQQYTWYVKACNDTDKCSQSASCSFTTAGAPTGQPPIVQPPIGQPRGGISISNPLKFGTIPELIDNLIKFIYLLGMGIAPIMIIIAGFFYITAAGDPKRITTAKTIILYTVIGLVIVLLAKGLISVIKGVLGG